MHSSLADLDDETAQAVLRALYPTHEPFNNLPPDSLPFPTSPSRKLLKNALRRMNDHFAVGPYRMPVPHLKLHFRPRTGKETNVSGLAALYGFACLMLGIFAGSTLNSPSASGAGQIER